MLSADILAILASKGGPISGHQIWEELEDQRGKSLHSGTVYPIIKKLREDNFIRESKSESGSQITLYKITDKGRNKLSEHRGAWEKLQIRAGHPLSRWCSDNFDLNLHHILSARSSQLQIPHDQLPSIRR